MNDLTEAVFSSNVAGNGNGGAIRVMAGTVNTTNGTFFSNSARGGGNGGAVALSGGVLTDNGSMFQGNVTSGDGGGLWVVGATATLTNSKFDTNFADFWFGPGPRPQNQPERYGDGIFIEEKDGNTPSVVTATGVKFNLNGDEGGAAVHISTGGTLFTHSCNFFNNNGITRGMSTNGTFVGVYTPDPNNPDVGLMFNEVV